MVTQRLRKIQLLLTDLAELGAVDAERLRRERPTRHIVERVLSQIVELAGSINIHVVTSLLGRSPDSYAASFDEMARARMGFRCLVAPVGWDAQRPSARLP
jgi:hypothetical protein